MTPGDQDANRDLLAGSCVGLAPDSAAPLDQRIDAVIARFVHAGWPEDAVRVGSDKAITRWLEAGITVSILEHAIRQASTAVGGRPCRLPVLWLEERVMTLIVDAHVRRQQELAA